MVAIKQEVIVQPGGEIRLHSDQLPVGARAEVIVLVRNDTPARRSFASYFGAGKGGFKTAAEADAFLSAERDAWER